MIQERFPLSIGEELVRNERTLLARVEDGRYMMSPESVKYLVLHCSATRCNRNYPVEQLRRDPKEVAALFRDLLINVTNFFRDADAFDALRDQVIPKMFDGRGADETVRVWVPGCATGGAAAATVRWTVATLE